MGSFGGGRQGRGRRVRHDGSRDGLPLRLAALLLAALALLMPGALPARAEPARPLKLVALGDSLTAGYRLPADAAFPAVLERALKVKGQAVAIANAGVSGDTATGGLDRVDWSVPDGTDGVILELGANDMLRGTDPAVTRKALDSIIARLKGRGIPVLLAGMRASANLGPDYVARFDAIYPDLARQHGLVLYPFFLAGVAGERGLNLDDGLHPNPKGVETIVAGIMPSVETFLGRLGKPER
jgi:acyl-CoA thioesterase I